MRNYQNRIAIGQNKWAYVQLEEFASAAKPHIDRILKKWHPPRYFFHMQKGGHISAFQIHQHSDWYGKIDLSNFFGNITRNRIIRRLKSIGYSYLDAEDFSISSTIKYRERFVLPYGFIQSPLLASLDLDMSSLGKLLSSRTKHHNLSVYVDDILVSGQTKNEVECLLREIRAAAEKSNLPINRQKSTGATTELTAFNITISQNEMQITDERLTEMHSDVAEHGKGPVSDGILNYIRTVNPAQAENLSDAHPNCF